MAMQSKCLIIISDKLLSQSISCNITLSDNGNISGSGRHVLFNQIFSTNWEHYVCIVSQSLNRVKVYKNNVLIIDEAGFVNVDKNKPLRLAAPFSGTIDDFKIFNKVLSITEINSLYNE